MSKRVIQKVAVLGSGVMGSRIAAHFAGCGLKVLLLDRIPDEPNEKESAKGLSTAHPAVRNRIVNDALAASLKANPSPIYHKDLVKNIRTGNFSDNISEIQEADWIIEVVIERLDIKKTIFDAVEKYRRPGTLVSSNTSGIPIHLMAEGRSEDFRRHFCGTHFFNPPRYLRLLEIIPTPDTDPEVTRFLMQYGDLHLGKTTVLAKDTPAFIANRIGVFSIMTIFSLADSLGLTIDELEALTGPVIGRPKSATFRTADVVGIDTLVNVARGVYEHCPQDEARESFVIPAWLNQLVDKRWLGDKTGQGFFKKSKNAQGEKEILTLDLKTMEYGPRVKPKFATLESAKPVEDLRQRLKMLLQGSDKAGEFFRQFHYRLFSYIGHRVPEISDELYRIDDAMMAGFGWEIGAFESWDVAGVEKTVAQMEQQGLPVAPWIKTMLSKGISSFYKTENGRRLYYDVQQQTYQPLPGGEAFIVLKNFEHQTVWKNSACEPITSMMMCLVSSGIPKWAVSAEKCWKVSSNPFPSPRNRIKVWSSPTAPPTSARAPMWA